MVDGLVGARWTCLQDLQAEVTFLFIVERAWLTLFLLVGLQISVFIRLPSFGEQLLELLPRLLLMLSELGLARAALLLALLLVGEDLVDQYAINDLLKLLARML